MSFREEVEKGLGCAVILAGSGSDESNVGRFIAQMFSFLNPVYAEVIKKEINEKRESLEKDDANLRRKFSGEVAS